VNLGGPVIIPKIYNGRDKTFFFLDYEGFRLRQGQSSTQTVPTAVERTGDLSGYAAAVGTSIYDPLTTCGTNPSVPCPAGVATGARTPVAGNIIPSSRINPTSLKYLNAYFPMPNAPGDAKGNGNWIGNGSATDRRAAATTKRSYISIRMFPINSTSPRDTPIGAT